MIPPYIQNIKSILHKSDRLILIANFDLIHDLDSLFHLSKNGIPTIEVRRRRMGYKPLGSFGIFAGRSHANRARFVSPKGKLRSDRIIFAAKAVPPVASCLNDKIRRNPVIRAPVKVFRFDQINKIDDRPRCFVHQKAKNDIPTRCSDEDPLVPVQGRRVATRFQSTG